MIYTTNALKGFNSKYTKSRTIFSTDKYLNKYVYIATIEIIEDGLD